MQKILKYIYTNIFNRFKYLYYLIFNNKNFTLLNTCCFVFIFSILYLALINLNFEILFSKINLIGCLISFSVSGLITSFILNKFKYSQYFVIKILQLISLMSVFLFICLIIINIFL